MTQGKGGIDRRWKRERDKERKREEQLLTWGCVTAETVSANLLMFT